MSTDVPSVETATTENNEQNKSGNNEQNKSTKDGENKNTEQKQKDADDVKTISQRELSNMMTKEKRQGRDAAFRALGIDPKDEKAVERAKALIEGAKTPEQKAAETQTNENAAIKEAERRAIIAEAKIEAIRLGVQPQFVDDAIVLVMNKFDDGDDLKTLVAELKVKYPNWFVVDEDEQKEKKKDTDVGKKGTGTSMKSNGTEKSENKNLGARLAAQRPKNDPKKSYWQ